MPRLKVTSRPRGGAPRAPDESRHVAAVHGGPASEFGLAHGAELHQRRQHGCSRPHAPWTPSASTTNRFAGRLSRMSSQLGSHQTGTFSPATHRPDRRDEEIVQVGDGARLWTATSGTGTSWARCRVPRRAVAELPGRVVARCRPRCGSLPSARRRGRAASGWSRADDARKGSVVCDLLRIALPPARSAGNVRLRAAVLRSALAAMGHWASVEDVPAGQADH